MKNWDEAYANASFIPEGNTYPEKWEIQAKCFREINRKIAELNVPYGSHEREVYDVFRATNSKGSIVFIHGGYWQKFDKSSWSHFAQAGIERGYDVYIPSYPLCTEVSISEITTSIARFLNSIECESPIYLTGHSAGGHLVARMICANVLNSLVFNRIKHIMPISGLFDLRPLMQTKMNDVFRLNLQEARAESPALLEPSSIRTTLWVGADERPEFLRQSQLLANIWKGLGVRMELVIEKDKHHFNVIDGLGDSNSPLINQLLDPK